MERYIEAVRKMPGDDSEFHVHLLSPSHLFQKVAIRFSTEHIPLRLVILSGTNCQIVHHTCLWFFWRDDFAKGSW